MKIYVAGRFADRVRVSRFIMLLEGMGYKITRNWTQDRASDDGYPFRHTLESIEAVIKCDIFIGLFDKFHKYQDPLVEMGVALGFKKKVIVIGHEIDECFFMNCPVILKFDSIEQFKKEYLSD